MDNNFCITFGQFYYDNHCYYKECYEADGMAVSEAVKGGKFLPPLAQRGILAFVIIIHNSIFQIVLFSEFGDQILPKLARLFFWDLKFNMAARANYVFYWSKFNNLFKKY